MAPAAQQSKPPVVSWNWRTFPVYFALATGFFVGAYTGYLAGFVSGDSGNETPGLVLFIGAALLLGFGLARLTTRFMVTHNWVKPKAKQRQSKS